MKHETMAPHAWRDRCATRISELDPQLSALEAGEIAGDFQAFERTRAMDPEAAADFVVTEMKRSDGARFERRARSRAPVAAASR